MPLFLRVQVCAAGQAKQRRCLGQHRRCCPTAAGEPGPMPAGTARPLGCTCLLLRRGCVSDLQASACLVNWSCSPLITAGPGSPAWGAGSSRRGNFGFGALLRGIGATHFSWWDGASVGTSEGEMLLCCFPNTSPGQLNLPLERHKKGSFF